MGVGVGVGVGVEVEVEVGVESEVRWLVERREDARFPLAASALPYRFP